MLAARRLSCASRWAACLESMVAHANLNLLPFPTIPSNPACLHSIHALFCRLGVAGHVPTAGCNHHTPACPACLLRMRTVLPVGGHQRYGAA